MFFLLYIFYFIMKIPISCNCIIHLHICLKFVNCFFCILMLVAVCSVWTVGCHLSVVVCRLSAVEGRLMIVVCRCRSLLLQGGCCVSAVGVLTVDCRLSLSFIVVSRWLSCVGCRLSVVSCRLSLSFIVFRFCLSSVDCRVSADDCRYRLSIKILIVGAQLWI